MDNALVPNDGPGFAQQGSMDWGALSRSTITSSVEVLSRFAKAGVEMITVAIGQAIFANFKLKVDGQQRFSEAIAKLKSFPSYGNILWFGFGVKHIVNILLETEQGTSCAAMCACLSVSYDSLFGSRVLKALADQQATPGSLTPSLPQWSALLSVCAGAVSSSTFSKLVEGFSKLFNLSASSKQIFLNMSTSPDTLAGALLELAQISRGNVRSITFLGGADCAWLAAVSQWLLSLSVDITDENGSLLYRHRSPYCSSYAQVLFVRCLSAGENSFATTIKQKSFFIPPGQLCFEMDFENNSGAARHIFSGGRSEWTSILDDTFGSSIRLLLSPKNAPAFAHFLYHGFAAIWTDTNIKLDPCGVMKTQRERQRFYMSFASKRLPELAMLLRIGESQSHDAYLNVEVGAKSTAIKQICRCEYCVSARSSMDITDTMRGPRLVPTNIPCLKMVAMTVFRYIWILSWLDIDGDIYPSASGLRMLYYEVLDENYYDYISQNFKSRFFDQLTLPNIINLFIGTADPVRSGSGEECARCAGGVCVYLSSLKTPTTELHEQLRAVVVPGQIERRGSIYEAVVDKKFVSGRPTFNLVSEFLGVYGARPSLKLVVDETLASNVLEAYLLICGTSLELPIVDGLSTSKRKDIEASSAFGPSSIRRKIISYYRLGVCKSHKTVIQGKSASEQKIFWTGHCFSAREALWTDISRGIELTPKPDQWIIISKFTLDNCQILHGSYVLYYAIMCHPAGAYNFQLTHMTCLICSLLYDRWQRKDLNALERVLSIISKESSVEVHKLISKLDIVS